MLVRSFDCKADKKNFAHKCIDYNINNATKLLYVIIGFELFMLARVFLVQATPYPLYVWNYIICYMFLLVISLINLSCVFYAKRSKKDCIRMMDVVTTLYSIGFVLWGVAIAVCDSHESAQVVVYLTVIVCATSLLRLRPWVFLSLEFGGEALLIVGMLAFRDVYAFSDILNLSVFTLFFALITIIKYNNAVNDYYRNIKIDRVNEMLEDEKILLEKAARTDMLTGLLCRNVLKDDVTKRISVAFNRKIPVGIAMFDLDDFKNINDNYGHSVGDKCLVVLGEIFRKHSQLTVYRYGGEEFVAICDDISETEFTHIIADILKEIQTFKLPDAEKHLTISAGYVFSVPVNEVCDEKMIGEADHALYKAKSSGKNRFVKAE